jgi:hypothetical protein
MRSGIETRIRARRDREALAVSLTPAAVAGHRTGLPELRQEEGGASREWESGIGKVFVSPNRMNKYSNQHCSHFARYTIFPATIVHNTFASRISVGEIVKTSRSSKAKSARLPAAMVPMESRFIARAEFRV